MNNLIEETKTLGKPAWRPMLRYVAELHARSTRPPRAPFPYPWEEIGPGYCYGPAFGHWDLVHANLDAMVSEPEHARQQLLNNLAAQEESGLLPGVIWMRDEEPRWSHEVSHPPVWPVAVQDYCTHPISTVGVEDPLFELRMWRGPAWNSMTYWAARGCLGYEHALGSLSVNAAHALLEPALDNSAAQFDRTGTVWEFYHPHGGRPEDVQRKPHTPYNQPCRDYLGHNPLIAMARLWDQSA